MKTRWWIMTIVGGVVLVIGLLHQQGVITVDWKPLAILISALAGPFKLFDNWRSVGTEEKILKEHERILDQEKRYQKNVENKMKAKEEEIDTLKQDLQKVDQEIRDINLRKARVEEKVKGLNPEEKKKLFREAFG